MAQKPTPVLVQNHKDTRNRSYVSGDPRNPPPVHPINWHGNSEMIIAIQKFWVRDRRTKRPHEGRYERTVDYLVKKFVCSRSMACAQIAAARAHQRSVYLNQLPDMVTELVNNFTRLAESAERDGDRKNARQCWREVGLITGAYAPIKVDVAITQGPTLRTQLAAIYAVLPAQMRANLEEILATLEAAEREGRLQLQSGDEDESGASAQDDAADAAADAVEDAVLVEPPPGG